MACDLNHNPDSTDLLEGYKREMRRIWTRIREACLNTSIKLRALDSRKRNGRHVPSRKNLQLQNRQVNCKVKHANRKYR